MLKRILHAIIVGLMADPNDPNNPFEPLPTELEQVVDEARSDAGQGPAARSPEQGIADMNARIAYHTILAGKLQFQLETAPPERLLEIRALIRSEERQLAEARHRIQEYELQARNQN